MPSGAYYSENDPKAAATLRQLIKDGHIAPGDVDERSIEDVTPNELLGYTQVHLFAGFGLWSLAFRWGGIRDAEAAWSCSCPCQPFSAAGKGAGFADERHLWPAAFHLISHAKRPEVPLYGEQVASSRVMPWIDLVWNDMEASDHTFWPVILASAGFGAPIIRQRTFWVAWTSGIGWEPRRSGEACPELRTVERLERLRNARGLGTSGGSGLQERECVRRIQRETMESQSRKTAERRSRIGWMAGADGGHGGDGYLQRGGQHGLFAEDAGTGDRHRGPGPTNGFWGTPDWLRCRDDLWRPVESGTFPLAYGYPERVGLLRGFGNAISPYPAAYFIRAHREATLEVEGVI